MTSLTTWQTRKTTTMPTKSFVDLSPAARWALIDALPAEGTTSRTVVDPSARRMNVVWCADVWRGAARCESTLSDVVATLKRPRRQFMALFSGLEDEQKSCFRSEMKLWHEVRDETRIRVVVDVVVVIVVVEQATWWLWLSFELFSSVVSLGRWCVWRGDVVCVEIALRRNVMVLSWSLRNLADFRILA